MNRPKLSTKKESSEDNFRLASLYGSGVKRANQIRGQLKPLSHTITRTQLDDTISDVQLRIKNILVNNYASFNDTMLKLKHGICKNENIVPFVRFRYQFDAMFLTHLKLSQDELFAFVYSLQAIIPKNKTNKHHFHQPEHNPLSDLPPLKRQQKGKTALPPLPTSDGDNTTDNNVNDDNLIIWNDNETLVDCIKFFTSYFKYIKTIFSESMVMIPKPHEDSSSSSNKLHDVVSLSTHAKNKAMLPKLHQSKNLAVRVNNVSIHNRIFLSHLSPTAAGVLLVSIPTCLPSLPTLTKVSCQPSLESSNVNINIDKKAGINNKRKPWKVIEQLIYQIYDDFHPFYGLLSEIQFIQLPLHEAPQLLRNYFSCGLNECKELINSFTKSKQLIVASFSVTTEPQLSEQVLSLSALCGLLHVLCSPIQYSHDRDSPRCDTIEAGLLDGQLTARTQQQQHQSHSQQRPSVNDALQDEMDECLKAIHVRDAELETRRELKEIMSDVVNRVVHYRMLERTLSPVATLTRLDTVLLTRQISTSSVGSVGFSQPSSPKPSLEMIYETEINELMEDMLDAIELSQIFSLDSVQDTTSSSPQQQANHELGMQLTQSTVQQFMEDFDSISESVESHINPPPIEDKQEIVARICDSFMASFHVSTEHMITDIASKNSKSSPMKSMSAADYSSDVSHTVQGVIDDIICIISCNEIMDECSDDDIDSDEVIQHRFQEETGASLNETLSQLAIPILLPVETESPLIEIDPATHDIVQSVLDDIICIISCTQILEDNEEGINENIIEEKFKQETGKEFVHVLTECSIDVNVNSDPETSISLLPPLVVEEIQINQSPLPTAEVETIVEFPPTVNIIKPKPILKFSDQSGMEICWKLLLTAYIAIHPSSSLTISTTYEEFIQLTTDHNYSLSKFHIHILFCSLSTCVDSDNRLEGYLEECFYHLCHLETSPSSVTALGKMNTSSWQHEFKIVDLLHYIQLRRDFCNFIECMYQDICSILLRIKGSSQ